MLFVICWSGTIAVLGHEIDWLLNPALRVEPAAQPGKPSWSAVVEAAQAAVPGHRVTALKLPEGPRDAAELLAEDGTGGLTRVYVDPHTARVQGTTSYFNVQRFFRSLHMNLFVNAGAWGYLAVGAFSFVLLASLATALVFYRRWWCRFLVMKTSRGLRVLLSDVHKTGGLWSLWFVLLMGITGAWYFIEAAGISPEYPEAPEFPKDAHARRPLDELLQQAQVQWPDLEVRNIWLPGSYLGEVLELQGQADALLVRDRANRLFIDPATGAALARQQGSELDAAARWVDTADPLHFGNFAGLGVKLVWFAFGIVLSGLSLTGAYLHVQRLERSPHPHRSRGAVIASHVASALLLGIAAWGGWREIFAYGPLVNGVRQWPEVPAAVIFFIVAWLVLTATILVVWARKLR